MKSFNQETLNLNKIKDIFKQLRGKKKPQTFSSQLKGGLTLQTFGFNTKAEDFWFRYFLLRNEQTKGINH